MNEYQKQVELTLNDLFSAARKWSGKVLNKEQVRQVCSYIQNMDRALQQRDLALAGADNLLAAYTNEYGSELLDALIASAQEEVEGYVEGEVAEEDRRTDESVGLDASEEE